MKRSKGEKEALLEKIGYTLYILECADSTYFAGWTNKFKKEITEINLFKIGAYFSGHPERFPVKIVFLEKGVPFREAYSKYLYMKKMNHKQRKRLIEKKKWPEKRLSWRNS